LELLKVRFGEQSLQNCDIMLKDLKDSKRLNKLIHDKNSDIPEYMRATIVSHLFWPSFREESLKLPESIHSMIEQYSGGYQMMKRDRKLEWFQHLGTVDIELEIQSETKSFSVSPILATLIYHFQTKRWYLMGNC
jgi:anaphase-promoting complex subunit 2